MISTAALRATCRGALLACVAALVLAPTAAWGWGTPRSGGFGPSLMRGGPGADFLRGAEGHDRVYGRGGADLLTGDTGPDLLSGGSGDDTLSGGSGIDVLRGGDGGDIASGGFGADLLDGGAGADALDGGYDKDTILGGPGHDLLHGGSGIDRIDGGSGNDRIFADSGGDTISGGPGDDVVVVDGSAFAHVTCGPGRDTVYLTVPPAVTTDYAGPGTAGSRAPDCEVIQLTDAVQDPNRGVTYLADERGGTREGTALDDVLLGGTGADTLRGRGGNDVLWGLRLAGVTSTQPDALDAGPGDDTVYGGPGPQRISGGAGDDFLEGGVGDNVINAGAGDDTIRLRGAGLSTVRGGAGRDTIFARGSGRGVISCGAGRDVVHLDRGDRVSRDCERVVGTPLGRTRAAAAARPSASPSARSMAAAPRAAGATYADLVAATPGLRHWWRMSPGGQYGPFSTYFSLVDRVTGTTGGGYITPPVGGPTDDGDTAYDSAAAPPQALAPGVPDTVLHGSAFTFEGWFRAADDGRPRALLNDTTSGSPTTGIALVREGDGSLRATISAAGEPARVQLQSPPLAVGTRWHHVALSRAADRIALFVDGDPVADAPALPVPDSAPAYTWYIGGGFGDYGPWQGGIDEVALYDTALDAATIRAHARVGEDGVAPVARTQAPLAPVQTSQVVTRFVTDKGGSSFHCGLDGRPLAVCPDEYVSPPLAEGYHELRVVAIDRFGVVQITPTVLAFVVDSRLPNTIALVILPADGDRQPILVMGSDKPATFTCFPPGVAPAAPGPGESGLPAALQIFRPCANPTRVSRGAEVTVQAVDASGNSDAYGATIPVPPAGWGFTGTEPGLPTFAGARAEVGIGGPVQFLGWAMRYQCRIDGAPWLRCPSAFRLPILHAGRHTIQVRRSLPGTADFVTSREFVTVVEPSKSATLIVGLQANLITERGTALVRRAPLVRFALNRPAVVSVELRRGAKRALRVLADGRTGPNVVTLPARRLAKLATGRYSLVVTARGSSGPVATQRLPLALVRPLG